MLRDLLLVLNMLICVALIGVVLLQRSEGGAFGTGGPTGLVTARGAGDLLTRTTWVLFTLFLTLSLTLTLVGGRERSSQAILERLKNATVNPDTLTRPAPPPAGAPSSSSSAPPPVQLPPISGSGAARTPASTSDSLALPPVGAPVNQRSRSPAP